MKRNIIIGTVFFTMIAVPGAYATTQSGSSTIPTPASEPTTQPTIEPSAAPAPISSPAPQPTATSTPIPTPSYAPGMAPGEHAGWVAVNPDGSMSGGVMVCTPEVCGQTGPGSWLDTAIRNGAMRPGVRLVLQTLQDPVEARNSPNGVGNVAGYSGGTYNFQTGKWTINDSNGSIYEIPLAYPGADREGNTNFPLCIENCPTPDPESFPTDEPSPTPSPSESEESVILNNDDTNIAMQERRISVKPLIINNNVVINKKINDKVFRNQVLIVATKNNKRKVWTQQVNGKIVSIRIPRKYLFWNISIRYIVR